MRLRERCNVTFDIDELTDLIVCYPTDMRPYIIVSKIPNFDPTRLPYWSLYVNEGKDKTYVTLAFLDHLILSLLTAPLKLLAEYVLFAFLQHSSRRHHGGPIHRRTVWGAEKNASL